VSAQDKENPHEQSETEKNKQGEGALATEYNFTRSAATRDKKIREKTERLKTRPNSPQDEEAPQEGTTSNSQTPNWCQSWAVWSLAGLSVDAEKVPGTHAETSLSRQPSRTVPLYHKA
jgi:hypothetical protein